MLLGTARRRLVVGEPARGPPDRLAGRDDVAVTELRVQPRQVEHPVRRRGLPEQRPGRHRQVVRHRDEFELGAELGRAQLDDLADGQHLFVGDVEDRAAGALRMVDRGQQRGRAVLGVAVVMQRQAARRGRSCGAARRGCAARSTTRAGPAGAGRTCTDSGNAPPRDAPRTPPARCGRCGSPFRRSPGSSHEVGVLGDRHRQPGRRVLPGVGPAAVGGHAAHRDEHPGAAAGQLPRSAAAGRTSRRRRRTCRSPSASARTVLVVRVGVQVRDLAAASPAARAGRGAGS